MQHENDQNLLMIFKSVVATPKDSFSLSDK